MMMQQKWLAWCILALNVILIWLVYSMQNMVAMYLMAGIMTIDAVVNLIGLYSKRTH